MAKDPVCGMFVEEKKIPSDMMSREKNIFSAAINV